MAAAAKVDLGRCRGLGVFGGHARINVRTLNLAWAGVIVGGIVPLLSVTLAAAQALEEEPSFASPTSEFKESHVGETEAGGDVPTPETDSHGTSERGPTPTVEADTPVKPESHANPVLETGSGLFEQASVFDAEVSDAGVVSSAAGYELSGYVRGDVFMGKIPGFRQGELQAGYGELSLRLRAGKSAYGDAFAETRLRYGMQGTEPGFLAELREGYVNAYLGPVDIRLGQQIIVWGKADGFNPTNNLTPTNWSIRSPHEDDRRMGSLAARVFYNAEPLRVEGVWVPLYRAVELPPYERPKFVVDGDTTYPRPEFLRGTWAGKLHLNLASVDLSASYLYGYAPLPGFTLQRLTTGSAAPEPEVRVSRTAYNHHVVGADFATTLGENIGLRGEVAYRKPLHYARRVEAPRPDVQYVLGFDTNVGAVGIIAQYFGRYTFDWQKDGPETPPDPEQLRTASYSQAAPRVHTAIQGTNQMLFQQLARVQHLVSLRVAWATMHEALHLSMLGLVNASTKEWALHPKLGYEITDNLLWSLGGEVYAGPEGTLFGLLDSSLSAGYTELKVSF